MKEVDEESLNLTNPKNSSMPISLEKMKKSKLFQNKTTRKFHHDYKKSISKEKNNKLKKKFFNLYIINTQLQKHNSNPLKKV